MSMHIVNMIATKSLIFCPYPTIHTFPVAVESSNHDCPTLPLSWLCV